MSDISSLSRETGLFSSDSSITSEASLTVDDLCDKLYLQKSNCYYCNAESKVIYGICGECVVYVVGLSVYYENEFKVYTTVPRQKNTYFGGLNPRLPQHVYSHSGEFITDENSFRSKYGHDDNIMAPGVIRLSNGTYLDATYKRTVLSMISASENPNCEFHETRGELVCLYFTTNIAEGEELTIAKY